MTDIASTSTVNIIAVPGELVIDLTQGINMQSVYNSIIDSSTYTLIGIDLPLLGIDCEKYRTVNSEFNIKEAVSNIFSYGTNLLLKPIVEILEALAKALGVAVDEFFKLPVFDLNIKDFFRDDLWAYLETIVKSLWEAGGTALEEVLSIMDIPWPFFEKTDDLELKIKTITKDIGAGLLNFIIVSIRKIVDVLETALRVFDFSNYEMPVWSEVWKKAIDAFLKGVEQFFTSPLTLKDLLLALTDFAKETLKLPVVTAVEILSVIERFSLPILGLPLDWNLPVDSKTQSPERDLSKILADMFIWIGNFFVNIFKKFIEAVGSVLNFFGISIPFPTEIKIPFSYCVVENPPI